MNKINVVELFSGYGSQSLALRNIGIDFNVSAISEIDPDAIISYGAIRGYDLEKELDVDFDTARTILMNKNVGYDLQKNKSSIPRMKTDKLTRLYNADKQSNNLGDVSIINTGELKNIDLLTYSFPCTDISVAGKGEGLTKGSGTRSGLLWECEKIISSKKPKYLLMENVKNLIGKKHKVDFDKWCEWLESQGYNNYYEVLNAKNFGIPQNRERVFMISILGEHEQYEFPKGFELNLRLKDILEDEVDEKYYLSEEIQQRFTNSHGCEGNNIIKIPQATKKGYIELELPGIADLSYPNSKTRRGRVQDSGTVSPTLTATQQDICYIEKVELPCICASRGRNPENPNSRVSGLPTEQRIEINKHGVSNTITTVQKDNYAIEQGFRIRKLTPRECYRLMGLNDEDINAIERIGISNTQMYKQAGNSIVVNVLEHIFRNLLLERNTSTPSNE